MPTTTYKGYEVQTTGSNSGTWGSTLNDDMISVADRNVGGIVTKTLSNSNVVLSATESQYAILRLTGVLSASVIVTTSCQGFLFVENATTGDFGVTITNGVAGVAAPQGTRTTYIVDATNGVRVAGTGDFPSGTVMVFYQNTAPTGWTKRTDSSFNNAAIRLTTGTGGTTGGSTLFTDTFSSSRTISQANLPNVNLSAGSLTATTVLTNGTGQITNAGGATSLIGSGSVGVTSVTITAATTMGGYVPLGGSGTGMNFDVYYLNFIVAGKN